VTTTATSPLSAVSSQWKTVLAFVGTLTTLIGAFVVPPPFWLGTTVATTGAKVGTALLVGFLVVALGLYPPALSRVRQGLTLAVFLTALAFTALGSYWELQSLWVRLPDKTPIVIGTTLLPGAIKYRHKLETAGLTATDNKLLMDFASDPELIWPRAEIQRHQLLLIFVYFVTVALFTAAVTAVTQTALFGAAPWERG